MKLLTLTSAIGIGLVVIGVSGLPQLNPAAIEALKAQLGEESGCPYATQRTQHEKAGCPHLTGELKKRATFDPVAQKVSTSGAHAWVAPKAGDQRGPCPGLNALANHGYLPHNGVADIPTIISAVNTGKSYHCA